MAYLRGAGSVHGATQAVGKYKQTDTSQHKSSADSYWLKISPKDFVT